MSPSEPEGSIQRTSFDCCAGIRQTGELENAEVPLTGDESPALPYKKVASPPSTGWNEREGRCLLE